MLVLELSLRGARDPLQLRHGAERHGDVRLPPAAGPDHSHRGGGLGLPSDRGQGADQGICTFSRLNNIQGIKLTSLLI